MIANDAIKTVTSDGSPSDTLAASLYIKGKNQDGWVLIIGEPGGAYSWTAAEAGEVYFDMPRNCTIKGASPTDRPTIALESKFVVAYAPNKMITVRDIIFVSAATSSPTFFVRGHGPKAGFRFTNIRWEGDWPGQLMWIGDGSGQAPTNEEGPYGLIDNCEGDGHAGFNIYCNKNAATGWNVTSWRRPLDFGTEKTVVFEDCYFRRDSYTPGAGLTDNFLGGSFMFRNSVIENVMLSNHGSDHYSNHQTSAVKHEIYRNTFRLTEPNKGAHWLVYLRGGTGVIHDNTFEVTGAGSSLIRGIYWDYYRANWWAGPQNTIYDRWSNPLDTTIAAASNGQSLPQRTIHVADTSAFYNNPVDFVGPTYTEVAVGSNGVSLPQGTLHVTSTAEFPESGVLRVGTPDWVGEPGDNAVVDYTGKTATSFTGCTTRYGSTRALVTGDTVAGVPVGEEARFFVFLENIKIMTSNGVQTIRATGKTATSFTGCFGGTGVMSTGGAVTRASDYLGSQQPGCGPVVARVAAGSNGVTLPQATIHVDDTIMFPTSGKLLLNYDPVTGAGTEVTYTGKTATSFTGCSGGTGALATGGLVGGIGQDPRHLNEPVGSVPIWHWNNQALTSGFPVSASGVGDFIMPERDIFIRDTETVKPSNTGTWVDAYVELEYPHPARAAELPSANSDTLVLDKIGSAAVTVLWNRKPVDSEGPYADVIKQVTGDYPPDFENGYDYARHGTGQKLYYVFSGHTTLEQAQAARP